MPAPRHRLPPPITALCLALALASPYAAAGGSFCGEHTTTTVPSDLENVVGDQSLEYIAQQPAGLVTCSKGYLLEKCGDHENANKVFDKCIAAGYAGAMIWKARLLEEGSGVERDVARAAELLHRAAVSGDPAYGPIGKMHYATMLHHGRGVQKNEAEALKWFQAAAAEGSQEARDFLRTGYHTGARDYSTLGAGTPDAAALASLLPAGHDGQAAQATAAPAARGATARKLVNDASATPPDAPPPRQAPPDTPPSSPTAAAIADVQGQKLERRASLPAPSLPQASAGLGLLLLLTFLAGVARRNRQDRAAAPAADSLS